jgi:hypothetical protein
MLHIRETLLRTRSAKEDGGAGIILAGFSRLCRTYLLR